MPRRLRYGLAIAVLTLLVAFLVWQVSFHVPEFDPANFSQSVVLWAVTILAVVLVVALGWVLVRTGIKLYVDRQAGREGSRLRTKLVVGALGLCIVPVFFLVFFGMATLNLNMNAWFTKPEQSELLIFKDVSTQLLREMKGKTAAQAALLAQDLELRQALYAGGAAAGMLDRFVDAQGLASAEVYREGAEEPFGAAIAYSGPSRQPVVWAEAEIRDGAVRLGRVEVAGRLPIDVEATGRTLQGFAETRARQLAHRSAFRFNYMMLMAMITLFVLIVATWLALFLARQISVPIAALLEGASEVRAGNLRYRVDVKAGDELGKLVRGFNRMIQELETSRGELEQRRRFTEAILESIPTGVISITADGVIRRINRALSKVFPADLAASANRLEDLFSREDTAEIKYLMKRARRTGAASRQLELRAADRTLQVAVTVSALEEKLTSGFVIVLEDTTELLRAQKSAAWREVARRVAHEIKNPLTPIALSAERISRQLARLDAPGAAVRIVEECAATITKSVDSVKLLVDEFSQFARFPTVQPVRSDLNEVVREALAVFQGRLEDIGITTDLSEGLAPVMLDREQFVRVVVNLVDNAAEAMQDSLVKSLHIATQPGAAETVELVVADSGCGVSPEDKERLFLPYFSTKRRGTGLGLAIVSHIAGEHGAHIRVEDNQPAGARFTVEIPAIVETDVNEAGAQPAAGKL